MSDEILGFEVRTDERLGPHDFVLMNEDEHGLPESAVGYVNGQHVGPVTRELATRRARGDGEVGGGE